MYKEQLERRYAQLLAGNSGGDLVGCQWREQSACGLFYGARSAAILVQSGGRYPQTPFLDQKWRP